jgi:acyl carrier protein
LSSEKTKHYDAVFDAVQDVLVDLFRKKGIPRVRVDPHASIFEDLGVDSLLLVDLTLVLEERLSLSELPVQAWIDQESRLPGNRHTVDSLVRLCMRSMSERGRE